LDLHRTVWIAQPISGVTIARWATYVYQTHPAHANRLHFGVVAKYRDFDANLLGSIHN
jgi:hypothetical protein